MNKVESMEKVIVCKHEFEDTGYSRMYENDMVHMQRCVKCDTTIQRKSEGEFTLGYWGDR